MTALADGPAARLPRRSPAPLRLVGWGLVIVALAAVTPIWTHLTHAHPSYDAYGWMVWGHQVLYGHLNTGAAPSWKPLPFLFDLPFALFGRTQLSLWTYTASYLGLAGGIFAFRIAFRLSSPDGGYARRIDAWPSVIAGLLGIGALFALYGYWHQLLITDTDPIDVTLCLAAVDAFLSGHRRLTLLALFGVSYGRPEGWILLFLYGGWMARRREDRWLVALAFVLVPIGWFLVPGLTSKSFFQAGTAALGFRTAILHGNRFTPVVNRIHSLYDPACWYVISASGIWALVRWNRRLMLLFAIAAVWVLVEIGFAYDDLPAAPRYLMEPAALLGVLGAGFAGTGIRFVVSARPGPAWWWALRAAALAGVVAAAAALVPFGSGRVGALRADITYERYVGHLYRALGRSIERAGGPARILACAHPLAPVGDQSVVAWLLGRNVADIAHKPGHDLARGLPAVYIRPSHHPDRLWRVTAVNVGRAGIVRCAPIPVRLAPTNHRALLAYLRARQRESAHRRSVARQHARAVRSRHRHVRHRRGLSGPRRRRTAS